MNIAIYMARFLPATGGIVNYVVNLVTELIKYGIRVEIHVDNVIPVDGRKVTMPRGKILSNEITLVPEIDLMPSLHLRLAKATGADIINIHAHAEIYTLAILTRLSKLRKPIVLTTHGSLISSLYRIGKKIGYDYMFYAVKTKLKYKIFNSVSIKLIDKYVDMIITPSELEKKALLMNNNIPSYRIIIIKNFIPDRYFEFRPQESETILGQLGLVPFKYIITVARIDRNKSIHQVIKAIANLHNQGTSIKYVIIGPDEGALRQCLALTRKYNIERSIVYLGSVTSRRLILTLERYALAFVLPSYIETAQPLSILEAMSQATPIIISNTANFIGKAVKHMFNGLVFSYGNTQSLAYAIRMLLEDEALRKKLGVNAFNYACEHHRLSKAVDKYIKIFKTLYEIYHS